MKSFSMAPFKKDSAWAGVFQMCFAAKAARAAKVKRMWKSALEACAGPAAAVFSNFTRIRLYIIRKN